MRYKGKIILIIIEVFLLVVLLLLGIGCQQRWIIITGNGPRFDWYAQQDKKNPMENIEDLPSPEASQQEEPAITEEPSTTPQPPATTESTEPDESTTESSETVSNSGLGDTELPPI